MGPEQNSEDGNALPLSPLDAFLTTELADQAAKARTGFARGMGISCARRFSCPVVRLALQTSLTRGVGCGRTVGFETGDPRYDVGKEGEAEYHTQQPGFVTTSPCLNRPLARVLCKPNNLPLSRTAEP